jgi:hypothetical protein
LKRYLVALGRVRIAQSPGDYPSARGQQRFNGLMTVPVASIGRLVTEPDRRQPPAMGFTDKPAIDLPHADPDAAVRRQIAVALRHHHRHAPADVVRDYGIGESGVEHLGLPSRHSYRAHCVGTGTARAAAGTIFHRSATATHGRPAGAGRLGGRGVLVLRSHSAGYGARAGEWAGQRPGHPGTHGGHRTWRPAPNQYQSGMDGSETALPTSYKRPEKVLDPN